MGSLVVVKNTSKINQRRDIEILNNIESPHVTKKVTISSGLKKEKHAESQNGGFDTDEKVESNYSKSLFEGTKLSS